MKMFFTNPFIRNSFFTQTNYMMVSGTSAADTIVGGIMRITVFILFFLLVA